MVNVAKYTATTFAPVQGFIEKSRKLRDLYGASLILSYLSQQLVKEAEKTTTVISPALPNVQKGMPNRILIKGEFSQSQVEKTLLSAWKGILQECRTWIEKKLPDYKYFWDREWTNWGNHAWEIFWAEGDSIQAAMDNLETRKLSRGWTAVNWIGESSSLTGTDGIAFPGLGGVERKPKNRQWTIEKDDIKTFYQRLACVLENLPQDAEPEGKFFALHEKLSIPELVKRLVTLPEIAHNLGMSKLESFSEIYRGLKAKNEEGKGRWTGWFMGDGDEVGKHLKKLAELENGDDELKKFSQAMRLWGKDFTRDFPQEIGRVVYAGGDDFLGAIYREKDQEPITAKQAFAWLTTLPQTWEKHDQKIGLSVGFVWAGSSVPQRDILKHCREAEKLAKSSGRGRVTIRIVFNSGQYVQWTCPWNYLDILTKYQDREKQSNWSHIYQDLAQLQSRRAFNIDKKTFSEKFAIEFFNIYFPGEGEKLLNYEHAKYLVGFSDEDDSYERAEATVNWISDLIKIGWHLSN
ncbi:Cas10/Cmr2 second palm domain-containing protein [Halotia branconii]|uniref:Type III-B CRISPR-associated protein Cas10/Cmr2 n=1 Tax=Halotia branconii CENA392 TaxID=1539056 RepID=A0AAJ6NPP4_9CYAN|nr:type III-B CRISPR-associated protein Cas10/Cmr2 [Halotia branconii]WGV24278.1 type III-B CRISPR-associated protein Cas10/Cmr2 [Halotia branconii CENA392]